MSVFFMEDEQLMGLKKLVKLVMRRYVSESRNSRFAHDVMAAMLEALNKETAAMLEPRPNPAGI